MSSLLSPRGGESVSVVHLTAEYFPYARTGGLAEAVAGLANFQHAAGLDVTAILPLYRSVRDEDPDLEPVGQPFVVPLGSRNEEARVFRVTGPATGPQVFFIEHLEYFNRHGIYGESGADYPDNHRRFAFFALAAMSVLPRLVPRAVLVHAHDWHTALAPVYLRTILAKERHARNATTVVSVHNPGYQGHFGPEVMPEIGLPWELYNWQQLEWYGKVNFLKGGIVFADSVTTVSPTQAKELRTPGGGFGLHHLFTGLGDRLVGVLNGIDQRIWNPATDTQITAQYSAEKLEGKRRCKAALQRSFGLPQRRRVPLFGMTGRLVTQKGLDLILGAGGLLGSDAQFVFLGSGDPRYEHALVELARSAPNRIGVQLDFTDRQEHRLMAGADIFLMPSLYEPCGLTQMRAQRYGAPPIVRRVGGLADTVEDGVTGFAFDGYTAEAFQEAGVRALRGYAEPAKWQAMVRRGMARDFSWERSVDQYLEVYRRAIAYAAMR
ncbi:MAG TPA: glycogen synthase GlgA [Gemmatimonadales bacterium]|jgi:starch synthase|nr:glycogen synthase GlgA [Gemmatimonadales bacterium]